MTCSLREPLPPSPPPYQPSQGDVAAVSVEVMDDSAAAASRTSVSLPPPAASDVSGPEQVVVHLMQQPPAAASPPLPPLPLAGGAAAAPAVHHAARAAAELVSARARLAAALARVRRAEATMCAMLTFMCLTVINALLPGPLASQAHATDSVGGYSRVSHHMAYRDVAYSHCSSSTAAQARSGSQSKRCGWGLHCSAEWEEGRERGGGGVATARCVYPPLDTSQRCASQALLQRYIALHAAWLFLSSLPSAALTCTPSCLPLRGCGRGTAAAASALRTAGLRR